MSQEFDVTACLAIVGLWFILLAISIGVPLKISICACQWYYGNCYLPANSTAGDSDGVIIITDSKNSRITPSKLSSLSTFKTISIKKASLSDAESLENSFDDDDDDMVDVEL